MANKDFRVKNKLQVSGITNAGPIIADASGNLDSTAYIATQYGGTGTSTSPSAGQILYSTSGTTYSPSSTSVVYPSQSGNSGKFLTTDGSSVSWSTPIAITLFDGGGAFTVYTGGINGGGAS